MDITNLSLADIANMFCQKLSSIFNLPTFNNIDWSNLTSSIITIIITFLTSAFILWLLKSIGLYTMAKNNGDDYAFLAFIPYGCMYTKGKIVGSTKLFGIEIKHPEWLLPLIIISMFFPFTRAISSILLILFDLGILYRIYQKQVPNFANILLIFSIFLPILKPFFVFFIRNSNNNN